MIRRRDRPGAVALSYFDPVETRCDPCIAVRARCGEVSQQAMTVARVKRSATRRRAAPDTLCPPGLRCTPSGLRASAPLYGRDPRWDDGSTNPWHRIGRRGLALAAHRARMSMDRGISDLAADVLRRVAG